MGTARPTYLAVRPDAIHAELRARPQGVVWRAEQRKGRWTKVPYDPRTGRSASSTDPATWATWEEAGAAYLAGGWDGVGYALSPDDPYSGLDLDHCRDPLTGAIAPWALAILAELGAVYVEVSPSATGLRAIVRARKPAGRCRAAQPDGGALEVYDRSRYLTLTGHVIGEPPAIIPDRQAVVEAICARLAPRRTAPRAARPASARPAAGAAPDAGCSLPLTAGELARWRCLSDDTHQRITRLWGGDTAGYPTPSEADLALCSLLRAAVDGDRDRLSELMGASALGERAKWSDRPDYRTATMDTALRDYQPWQSDPAARVTHAAAPTAPAVPGLSGPAAAGPAAAPGERRPAPVIIADYWRATYDPTFRRAAAVYSAALGREVRAGEVLGTPTSELIELLTLAHEAPRTEAGDTIRSRLPQVYRTWAPVAWGDLVAALRDEGVTGEVVAPAEEEFRAGLAAAVLTRVSLGRVYRDGRAQHTETESRPLLHWAQLFAVAGVWGDVRGYHMWSTRGRPGEPPPGQLRVAIRHELLGQVRADRLAALGRTQLARLASLYGVGTAVPIRGGSLRAVELDPAWVADVLAGPAADTSTPGGHDTMTEDGHGRTRTREDASYRHGDGCAETDVATGDATCDAPGA